MRKATLYLRLEGQELQCTACAHYCRITPDNVGICGVRKNIGGELYLLVYGKAAAANVDPIEKKPLYHFLPGSSIFSIGTIGCNFGCEFCQNWEISQASKLMKKDLHEKGLDSEFETRISEYGLELSPQQIMDYAVRNKIPSIAFTYNEPTIFYEYAYDTAKLAHEKGIKNVFVSNGYQSMEAIEGFAPYLDAVNIDLKAFTESFYAKTCKARLEPVLEAIKEFGRRKIWQEITTLIIPGENDSPAELTQIAEFISSVNPEIPWHISRFHPDYLMRDKSPTPHEKLLEAYEIGKRAGLKFIYVGNVPDPAHEATYCPSCKEKLIERQWFQVTANRVHEGKCFHCGTPIPGVWS